VTSFSVEAERSAVAYENYSPKYQDIIRYLLYLEKPREEMTSAEFDNLRKSCIRYFVKEGLLFYRNSKDKIPRRVICNIRDQEAIILSLHEGSEGDSNHRGILGTFNKIRERYFWDDMYNQVKEVVQSCYVCQLRERKRLDEPLRGMTPRVVGSLI